VTDSWTEGFHDIIAKDVVVVFCGLNPSTGAAAVGHSFAAGSNRFWRAIHLAGFTPYRIAAENDRSLLRFGCGITAAVSRPTRSAGEVRRSEFLDEAGAFTRKMAHYRPHTIAFLGKAAYQAITGSRHLEWGPQPGSFGTAHVWLLPNPSGLNRAFGLDELVRQYGLLRAEVADLLRDFESQSRA
jgi:TDG/mug DNA glycosylase family protein